MLLLLETRLILEEKGKTILNSSLPLLGSWPAKSVLYCIYLLFK